MLFEASKVIVALATVFAVWFVVELFKLKRFYGTLKRLGIPGPEPSITKCGNLHDLFENYPNIDAVVEWRKKYGNLFGFYYENQITIVTHDLEILKTVFIDKQNIFDKREDFVLECPLSQSILYTTKDRWKALRKIFASAMFALGSNSPDSVLAIKAASKELHEYIDSFAKTTDDGKQVTKSMIINPIMESYTMTVFARVVMPELKDCNIGVDNFYSNLGNSYYTEIPHDPYYELALKFPFLAPIMDKLSKVFVEKTYYKTVETIFAHSVASTVEYLKMRRKLNDSYKGGTSEEEKQLDEAFENNANKTYIRALTLTLVKEYDEGRLTYRELQESLVIAFQASYDSLSRIYMNVIWLLAKHQDVQEKTRQEVKKYGHSAAYLNQVIQESIRLHPAITNFIRRKSNQACSIKGYNFPKGTVFMHALNSMTSDPSIWPEPTKFDPERFRDGVEISSLISQPFGFGAKMCPGYKYALNSLKVTISELLLRYKLKLNSPQILNMKLWSIELNLPSEDISIDLELIQA